MNSWLRKHWGVDKHPSPWNCEVTNILYEELDNRLSAIPDSFFLDDEEWQDGMELENDEVKVSYRRKQHSCDEYENLSANMFMTEKVYDKTMDKIKFVGGDFAKLNRALNKQELTERKSKQINQAEKMATQLLQEATKEHEENLANIIKEHRALLKTVKKEHKENIKTIKLESKNKVESIVSKFSFTPM
jgi:N-glycosylase/DNA lyase